MVNYISFPTVDLTIPVNTETGNRLSDSGHLSSNERILQRSANTLNAVNLPLSLEKNKNDLSLNTNTFAALHHNLTQIKLVNNSSIDTVLSNEECLLEEEYLLEEKKILNAN